MTRMHENKEKKYCQLKLFIIVHKQRLMLLIQLQSFPFSRFHCQRFIQTEYRITQRKPIFGDLMSDFSFSWLVIAFFATINQQRWDAVVLRHVCHSITCYFSEIVNFLALSATRAHPFPTHKAETLGKKENKHHSAVFALHQSFPFPPHPKECTRKRIVTNKIQLIFFVAAFRGKLVTLCAGDLKFLNRMARLEKIDCV